MSDTENKVNIANRLKGASVRFESEGLSALFSVQPPDNAFEKYTKEQVLEYLNFCGVKYGIDEKEIEHLIETKNYGRPVQVAWGKAAVNGEDGFFTYKFRTKIDNKPKIREDGSVDYHTVDLYEPVNEGDVIATYTRATAPKEGMSVRGTPIKGKPGKELPPIKGTGFAISKDFLTYTSTLNGKIALEGEKIVISRVLDIKGDVDNTTGDIIFDGDVMVQGGVYTGAIIHATGDVIIGGNVESVYITSGGSVELKSGMQGGGKGTIECEGNVSGKFFEQTIIRAKGDVRANSVMNCDIYAGKNVIISGKRGIIVGGTTLAIGNIEATIIGNMSEVKTTISVGVTDEMLREIDSLRVKTVDLNNNLYKLRQILSKVNGMTEVDDQAKLSSMRKQVRSTVDALERELDEVNTDIEDRLLAISTCSASRIDVKKFLFKGVKVAINGIRMTVNDTYTNVYVKDSEGEIKIINNY